MDSGVKLFVAVTLGILPFLVNHNISFALLAAYFMLATFLYGVHLSEMKKSMAAYALFIIVPYLFGLLIASLISKLTGSDIALIYQSSNEVTLRLLQLLLLWYASSLYFHATPTEEVIGVFDRLLSPLNRIEVPVTDFLKIVMCVIKELKELAPNVKKSFSESMGQIAGKASWKSKISGISYVLVSFIVNSFQRLDEVEEYVKQVESKDLFAYKCKISKDEMLLVMSLMLLISSIIWIEFHVV